MSPFRKISNLCLLLVATPFFVVPFDLHAATITVNTFNDDFSENDDCSLREAVASANADSAVGGCSAGSGVDTIVLTTGTYILSRSCHLNSDVVTEGFSDSSVECGDLDVTSSLTVQGAGSSLTVITVGSEGVDPAGESSSCSFRIFDLRRDEVIPAAQEFSCEDDCTEGAVLSLNGVTLEGGSERDGGAVRVRSSDPCEAAKLATSDVAFRDNQAFSKGGAVYVDGQVALSNSVVSSNVSRGSAGGLYLNWNTSCALSSTISDSTFSDNIAFDGSGGGILVDSDSNLTVVDSEFTGNNAPEFGGAIALVRADLSITSSLISGNGIPQNSESINPSAGVAFFSPVFGGGIGVANYNGYSCEGGESEAFSSLLIADTEVTGNQARFGGGGLATLDSQRFANSLAGSESVGAQGSKFSTGFITTTVRDSSFSGNSVEIEEFGSLNATTVAPAFIGSRLLGGGIYNAAVGKMSVERSTVNQNSASLGGGIANLFDMSVKQSTISDNEAVVLFSLQPGTVQASGEESREEDYYNGVVYSGGGGIFNSGALEVLNSTISGNRTDGSGAGLLNGVSRYYLDVFRKNNQPESEEEAPSEVIYGDPGSILNNITVALNQILPPPQLPSPTAAFTYISALINNGGGIATFTGPVTIGNSIVATNSDAYPVQLNSSQGAADVPSATPTPGGSVGDVLGDFAPDCYTYPVTTGFCDVADGSNPCELLQPSIISAGHNLIGNNLGCSDFTPSQNENSDQVGSDGAAIDPKLGPLSDNGGGTLTHSPLKGSSAIDRGSSDVNAPLSLAALAIPAKCEAQDQRGETRPKDGDLDANAVCDVGALEVIVDCNGTPGGSTVIDICGVCGGNGSTCAATPTPTPSPDLTCKEADISATLFAMDGSAAGLSRLSKTMVRQIRNVSGNPKSDSASIARSQELYLNLWNVTWQLPRIVRSDCVGGVAITCVQISNEPSIKTYTSNLNELYALNNKLITKLKRLKLSSKRRKALQKQNDSLYQKTLTVLTGVPSSNTACG